MHPSEVEPAPGIQAHQNKPTLRTAFFRCVATLGTIAVVSLVVSLFAALTHRLDGNAQALTPNVPASWQTYHDPQGLYSIRLPKEWTASWVGTATTPIGYSTGSTPELAESIVFSDPVLGTASASVVVNALAFQSDAQRGRYCEYFAEYGAKKPPHDISPQTLSQIRGFDFDSANAYLEVYVRIPGVIEPNILEAIPATPLPQQTVATDRVILATILNSFQSAEPIQLPC